ncbi:MAG: hypothetical protein ABJB32_07120 [Verrucomicrobiota bacterium]
MIKVTIEGKTRVIAAEAGKTLLLERDALSIFLSAREFQSRR